MMERFCHPARGGVVGDSAVSSRRLGQIQSRVRAFEELDKAIAWPHLGDTKAYRHAFAGRKTRKFDLRPINAQPLRQLIRFIPS